ncbi:MAG: HD domain-containing phosphohydrolase [Pseudomonadota bacterium]
MDDKTIFTPVTPYHDTLAGLGHNKSISDKLVLVHDEVRGHYPFIDRIAVAMYEPERDLLKTFIYSSKNETPLQFYETTLSASSSLSEIARSGNARVVNDTTIFDGVNKVHATALGKSGYSSSFTIPFYSDSALAGFIFMNSRHKNVFSEPACHGLSPFVYLISLLVLKEIDMTNVLRGSISSALDLSQHRDPETGAHLQRMSRYTRVIATEVAPLHGLNDEYVEYIYQFAPLHDVGKIAVPDRILLKPGRLTEEEFDAMKKHTLIGRDIVDRMLTNLRLQGMRHTMMLRDIVELHHEAIDGSGYPHGLSGGKIPLAARIIAVADIFDALTSSRPYKDAWSNAAAFDELERISGSKLDPQCVAALKKNRAVVEEIQNKFTDDPLG